MLLNGRTSRGPEQKSPPAKFDPSTGFYEELKRRVETTLADAGVTARDRPRMYIKIGIILSWFALSYWALVFRASTLLESLAFGLSLALAMGGIGFSVVHDASHSSVSDRRWINSLGALGFDFIGASSWIWRWKHNVLHHSFTNIAGYDSDINSEPFLRLSPHQRFRRFHRYQIGYAWFLYALLVTQWQFFADFKGFFRRRLGERKLKTPNASELVVFWGGKFVFLTWAFIIPAVFHSFWFVILGYLGVSGLLGLIMSVVFQIAHCTPGADFIQPGAESGSTLGRDWARHQVETSLNFTCENRLFAWYLGGLNFQIEHHLFPRICHVNYPLLAPVVRSTCREYGVRYTSFSSFGLALGAHVRWLWKLGRPLAGAPASVDIGAPVPMTSVVTVPMVIVSPLSTG